ncbi:Alpha-aminoadipate--LysW ligase LysX [Candidatus Nitrosocosmicus oleophilus]|jgi:[lysine-biosynthesis-protein LysW]---L-2-aminoadipate ligase|uniref:Alpha-aminoadipate--LysW ligase LysX n=1 Tax=Candidatus Nitrosocosmicus oleophilus TaxID=1353260 RepID=A0A654M1J9_9ARCH|nr:lysine biosynthesis protein LysX [Candidatus Nitrosocosmicus oleophilus]ALI36421.1 Alpha-aminoadipate--LysW ligase LysX [Candidatus Nitrosocosmicus oleophilus]
MAKLDILFDKLRFEEKALYNTAVKKGIDVRLVDSRNIIIDTDDLDSNEFEFGDVLLQRSISHFRGQFLTYCLELCGYNVINSSRIGEICGNKLLTSMILKKNDIPTPKSYFSFNSDSAFNFISTIDLEQNPLVFKPVIGSWGRGVFPVRNKEIGKIIVEMRQESTSPFSSIFYFQELIHRPPRDIRCIVVGEKLIAAVYRYSSDDEWRTNVAKGGKAELIEVTSELEELALKAARAVGAGVLGIDMMEDEKRGLVVHEINNTVEFRGASLATGIDIADMIIEYVKDRGKK